MLLSVSLWIMLIFFSNNYSSFIIWLYLDQQTIAVMTVGLYMSLCLKKVYKYRYECGSGFGLVTFAIVTLLKGVCCIRWLRQKKLEWKAHNLHVKHIMCQHLESWFMLLSQSVTFCCFMVSAFNDEDLDYKHGIHLLGASCQTLLKGGFTCLSASSFILKNIVKNHSSAFRQSLQDLGRTSPSVQTASYQ